MIPRLDARTALLLIGYRNDKGLVSLTLGAVVAGYRGIEHAAERQGARHAGQEGDAQG